MSMAVFLEKLLNGAAVEWVPLEEISILRRGRVMSKEYLVDNAGDFPVYSSQTARNGMIGKIDSFDFDGEYVSWTTDGANAGTVFYRSGKFSITNVCGVIRGNGQRPLDLKYLFYWLSTEAKKHVYSGMGNPKLMSHQVEKIPIPIPCPDDSEKSLTIQGKIVRILDSFAELSSELSVQLRAELTQRKKQFNHYRNQLFSFEDGEVAHLPLGDPRVGVFTRGGGLQKKDFVDRGVPCIHYGQIYTYYGTFADKTKSFVTEDFAKKARKAKSGDLVIATTSENDDDVCKAVAWLGAEEVAVSSDACFYTHNLNPRYVSYFFQTELFQKQKRAHITGTKVRRVNVDDLAKILIPIPFPNDPEKSLAEQTRISTILDKFEMLAASLSEGLPREIMLREKQYTYYRDLLLSFPKADDMAA